MTQNPAQTPDWQLHDDEGFLGLIGPVWEDRAADQLVLAFTAEDKHSNQRGSVQGGMLMTLADRVMGHALRLHLEGEPVATIQLDTHFLEAAWAGDWIEARARLTRVTRSVVFIEGVLDSGDRRLMQANGVWKRLRDHDGKASARFQAQFMR